MKFGTKTIHAGIEADEQTGAIMTPIYQTSTYVQEAPGKHKGYEYARSHNPTRTVLQNNIAALENGNYGLCFASGMAAIDTILKLLQPGDEVIATNDLYGGTYRIFSNVYKHYGIKFHFISMKDITEVQSYINENTRLIWIETPTNPLLNIIDIQAITRLAQKNNILACVDNTFASPYLQRPLELGADIVVHSLTKYMAGHSDVVMGAIVVNDAALNDRLQYLLNTCGANPGPQDCFLVLRGIKTLHLRMDRHCENARKIAGFLAQHPEVEQVNYPGLNNHPGHETAGNQMDDFGGMVSFSLKGDSQQAAFQLMEKLRFFSLAESLGGVESLAGHPASMTHASIPREERLKAGLKDTLIRLSVGVEDAGDLIADLEQAIG